MERLRVGVVGVGSMGRHHARVLAQHRDAELVAVVDRNTETAAKVAETFGVKALQRHDSLIPLVDAVSIAVPTVDHYRVARDFLSAGRHVLLEKPIASTVAEAGRLVSLAARKRVVLQVGHIERFNAAVRRFHEIAVKPVFIEAHRLGPFDPRVRDIGVVMDLMIHDLDIVLDLVRSPIRSVEAVGCAVLSGETDIANARIHFRNGCIANITASRISPTKTRKIRIFQEGGYVSIDYAKPEMETYRLVPQEDPAPGAPPFRIDRQAEVLHVEEPLMAELDHFLDCVKRGVPPEVPGEQAQDALRLAVKISRIILKNDAGRKAAAPRGL